MYIWIVPLAIIPSSRELVPLLLLSNIILIGIKFITQLVNSITFIAQLARLSEPDGDFQLKHVNIILFYIKRELQAIQFVVDFRIFTMSVSVNYYPISKINILCLYLNIKLLYIDRCRHGCSPFSNLVLHKAE